MAVFLVSVVSDAFRPAAMAALVRNASEETRTRALALARLAINAGMALGPAAGGWLATTNYGWLFVGDALTCWAAGCLLVWAARGRGRAEARVPWGGRGPESVSPWADGPFLVFLALMLLLGTAFLQIFATLPLYLREAYGMSERSIGSIFSINALVIVAIEMPVVRLLERRDRMLVAGAGGLLIGIGFGLMPFGSTTAFAVLTVLVWTFGEMLALPFTNAAVASRAGAGRAGSYMVGPEVLWLGVGGSGVLLAAGFARLSRAFRGPQGSPPARDR